MTYIPQENFAEELFANGGIFNISSNLLSVGKRTEVGVLLMKNPSASGINFLLKNLFIDTEITGSNIYVRLYRGATITEDGTELNSEKMNSLHSNTAGAKWYKNPETSNFGELVHTWILNKYNQPSSVIDMNFGWLIGAGDNIIMTVENFKNKEIAISSVWGETANS